MDIAARHNLIVIEDCARAHGTEWKGKKTGSIGHFGGYSFWTSKLMTAGEGGFLTVNDDSLFHRAWSVANQGRQIGGEFYEHSVLGCNERMSQFTAAILLGQLERLPGQIATRETNMQYLESLLAGVPGLRPAKREPRETTLTYFFATLHYDPAAFGGLSIDMFQRAMTAEGIPMRQGPNSPLSRNPIFAADALRANGVGHLYEARGGMIDYHALRFPVVENSLTVQMQHRTLLGPREQMEAVAEAAQKIRDNVGELLELAAKE
ncbi:MAG: L-glutamine:2-deoxy-scyllo-inosose aminotransferase [candidate division BRC1 bacterium ADurb.BinA364]|nr:MAG: L-glutamine:2-deoxy-scyllo-inosose aminotransferase [candidate division BRC1 bacterium ADurb.BinA364]